MARVLIIEDNAPYRELVRLMVERGGHKTDTAVNGDEGIKKYRKNPFDVVITDIFMPEKEGVETIKELRDEYPNAKIIAMSGGGASGEFLYLKFAQDMGADRIFKKPVVKDELLKSIRELTEDT